MKSIKLSLILSLISLYLISCNGIDQKNFNFENHITDNKKIIKELEHWDVDSAFIQFIGFAPSIDFEYYKNLSIKEGLNTSFSEELFNNFDLEQPIIKIWALRKNTSSGNSFEESGIKPKDLIDYGNGVGSQDAMNVYRNGEYSSTTYEYSPFYLALTDNKFRMLTRGYEEDRECIDFYDAVINLDPSKVKEDIQVSKKVGLYVKNKGIKIIDPSNRLKEIQIDNLAPINSDDDGNIIMGFEDNISFNFDNKINGYDYYIKNREGENVLNGKLTKKSNSYNEIKSYIEISVAKLPAGEYSFWIGDYFKKNFKINARWQDQFKVDTTITENTDIIGD
jgi:hypothetical protein